MPVPLQMLPEVPRGAAAVLRQAHRVPGGRRPGRGPGGGDGAERAGDAQPEDLPAPRAQVLQAPHHVLQQLDDDQARQGVWRADPLGAQAGEEARGSPRGDPGDDERQVLAVRVHSHDRGGDDKPGEDCAAGG